MAPEAPNYSRDVAAQLGLAAGASSEELLDRIAMAKRYVAGWAKGGWKGSKLARIEGVAERLNDLAKQLRKEAPFPARKTAAEYDRASSLYSALYLDLVLAPEQVPNPAWNVNLPAPVLDTMEFFAKLLHKAAIGGGIAIVVLGALYLVGPPRRR